jgi:hypothetical protein
MINNDQRFLTSPSNFLLYNHVYSSVSNSRIGDPYTKNKINNRTNRRKIRGGWWDVKIKNEIKLKNENKRKEKKRNKNIRK